MSLALTFSSIVEHGLNAYHHLFGALSFSSKRRLETGSKTEIFDLVCLFHRVLFTQKQHTVMLNSRSVAGMSPLSWGVYLGLANYVEYVIYYFSPNCLVKSEAIGITEHITMDVSPNSLAKIRVISPAQSASCLICTANQPCRSSRKSEFLGTTSSGNSGLTCFLSRIRCISIPFFSSVFCSLCLLLCSLAAFSTITSSLDAPA
uniref:Transmembrane protein n=1 Tax=Macrostomum lignano TaxID=282301 RepID=A0A1I8GXR8_9PLAT